ncbi:hypothetical protein Tco_0899912 [Tanacetum coccineum]
MSCERTNGRLRFRIPLEGDEILRVHGERTQGVVKTLMNTKVVKFRVDLVPGATEHQCRLLRRGAWSSIEVSVGITEEGKIVKVVSYDVNWVWSIKLTSLLFLSIKIFQVVKVVITISSIRCALFEALKKKCRSPVLWVEIRESSWTGLDVSTREQLVRLGSYGAAFPLAGRVGNVCYGLCDGLSVERGVNVWVAVRWCDVMCWKKSSWDCEMASLFQRVRGLLSAVTLTVGFVMVGVLGGRKNGGRLVG